MANASDSTTVLDEDLEELSSLLESSDDIIEEELLDLDSDVSIYIFLNYYHVDSPCKTLFSSND